MFSFLPNEILLLILDNTKNDKDFLNFYTILYKITGEKHKKRAYNIKLLRHVILIKFNHYKDMVEKIGKDYKYFDYIPKLHPKFLYEKDHGKSSCVIFNEMVSSGMSFCKLYKTIIHPYNGIVPKHGDILMSIKFAEKCDVTLYIDDFSIDMKNIRYIKFGYGLRIALSHIHLSSQGIDYICEYLILEDIRNLIGEKHRCVINDEYDIIYDPDRAQYIKN